MSRDDVGQPPSRSVKIGHFAVTESENSLVLRVEERGELSFNGCLVIALLLCAVLIFGILAICQFANESAAVGARHGAAPQTTPAQILVPNENQFGLLWLLSAIAALIAIPFYVARTYKSALTYSFKRSEDLLLRNTRIVTHLRRIEHLMIKEVSDPDGRYVCELTIVYGDGQQLLLHSAYDEREVKNIANEIANFVGVRVLWRE